MDIPVPASLYAVSIVELACLNRDADGDLLFYSEVFRVILTLCLNYTITIFFTAELGLMVGDQFSLGERDCPGDFMMLIFGCTFIFEVSMLTHFEKYINLAKLLYFANGKKWKQYQQVGPESPAASSSKASTFFPSSEVPKKASSWSASSAPPKMGSGAILAKEAESLTSRVYTRVRHPIFGDREDQHGMKRWTLRGTSSQYRLSCFLLIVLPKFCMDLMLAYLGGLFVASTDERDEMLMNTLAVVFIAEIDEMMYWAFTSVAMRYNLENMKSVKLILTNKLRVTLWLVHGFIAPGIAMCFAFYLTWHASGCNPYGGLSDIGRAMELGFSIGSRRG